ncbi:hypothetical protein CR64_15280, partial [Pseudomonas aeruginosa]
MLLVKDSGQALEELSTFLLLLLVEQRGEVLQVAASLLLLLVEDRGQVLEELSALLLLLLVEQRGEVLQVAA